MDNHSECKPLQGQIDLFQNGDQNKYSFIYSMLTSLSNLPATGKIQKNI